jgi:hypothetical protein
MPKPCPFCKSEDTVEGFGKAHCRTCTAMAPTELWESIYRPAGRKAGTKNKPKPVGVRFTVKRGAFVPVKP